ncbi:hypothetical protein G7075_15495 [Phycicoccus sp. HDW14]|uniref:hypothetical protein n=1 Tax=Phycicoccus sp. HDW14 TaxID=2714941 RepID=UPI00140BBE30|nr:hypothetical protein [Phycicoccus sp. HDW14]QIM19874.1 hypothetical protein G7075_15495 [Phycicoccus sp. HDW14]
MSFFEKAKAAASDLAAKADVAMTNAGVNVPGMGGDKALRDLGVIAWLDATGRPVADADRERVMATLRDLETQGRLGALTVSPPAPAYGTPPPPPGAAAAGAAPAAPPPPPRPRSGPAPAAVGAPGSSGTAGRAARPGGTAAGRGTAAAPAAQLGLSPAPPRRKTPR